MQFLGLANGSNFSAMSQVLPYLEASTIYNAINFSLFDVDPSNSTAMVTSINGLICPSDRTGPRLLSAIPPFESAFRSFPGVFSPLSHPPR